MKLDLGCGPNPAHGFEGVDSLPFDGKVTHVVNLAWKPPHVAGVIDPYTNKDVVLTSMGFARWPFEDNSVEEARSSHFLEHLTNYNDRFERVHFFNELHRILKPKAGCMITIPHWASIRYYGDPTHKEPFSEFGLYYLSKDWRTTNAPHIDSRWVPHGYSCDFDHQTNHYGLHSNILVRNHEFQMWAVQFYRDAVTDWVFTVVKK